MEYKLYCLEFLTGVHFGSKNLDSTEITFHADTLFAALFQEALKAERIFECCFRRQDSIIRCISIHREKLLYS